MGFLGIGFGLFILTSLYHVVVVLQEVQLFYQFLISAGEPILSDKPLPVSQLDLILHLLLFLGHLIPQLFVGNLLLDVL